MNQEWGQWGGTPQKSLSPSTSRRRKALLCPRRSHLAGFEPGDPPARVLIVALAVPAEMTDRGQFCWLTIIVLLITAMTFTGKPLQSHYLLMLNSATFKSRSLPPSPGVKLSGHGLVFHIRSRAAAGPGVPCESPSPYGFGWGLSGAGEGVDIEILVFLSPSPGWGWWRMQPAGCQHLQALLPRNSPVG